MGRFFVLIRYDFQLFAEVRLYSLDVTSRLNLELFLKVVLELREHNFTNNLEVVIHTLGVQFEVASEELIFFLQELN